MNNRIESYPGNATFSCRIAFSKRCLKIWYWRCKTEWEDNHRQILKKQNKWNTNRKEKEEWLPLKMRLLKARKKRQTLYKRGRKGIDGMQLENLWQQSIAEVSRKRNNGWCIRKKEREGWNPNNKDDGINTET